MTDQELITAIKSVTRGLKYPPIYTYNDMFDECVLIALELVGMEGDVNAILKNRQIIRYRYLDLLRSRGYSNSHAGKTKHVNIDDPFVSNSLSYINDGFERIENINFLRYAFRVLRPKDKRLLSLYYIKEYTQEEIAAGMALNRSMISRQLKKCRESLREAVI